MAKAVLLASALAACGTRSVSLPLVAPGDPTLFAYAIDYGPWQTLAGHGDGDTTTYQLDLDGDYSLAYVCVAANGAFHAAELFGTLDDAEVTIGSWTLPDCRPVETNSGANVEVEGQILDATHLALDGGASRVAPFLPWSLATTVAPGTHDIILWGDAAMRIIRDWRFDAVDNDLGVISVADASSLFVGRPYEVPVIGSEMATTHLQLTTGNGTVMEYDATPDSAYFPPASALLPSDREQFEIIAHDISGERGAILTDFGETAPDVDWLPQVQLPYLPRDTVRMHWTPIAKFFTSATIEYSSALGSQSATASRLWLERHAGTDLTFDEVDVPEYDPSWHVTVPAAQFTVERWSPGEILFTSTPQILL